MIALALFLTPCLLLLPLACAAVARETPALYVPPGRRARAARDARRLLSAA